MKDLRGAFCWLFIGGKAIQIRGFYDELLRNFRKEEENFNLSL